MTWRIKRNIEYKFRGYSRKKGVRTKMPMVFIERASYRADNPNEIRALKKGKAQAENVRNFFGI
jgi:hypothetical protein